MRAEDVANISTNIFAAALDQRKWGDVLKSINQCFPGIRTHIFTQDTVISSTTGFYTEGYDPAFMDQYSDYYADKNSWAPSFSAAPSGSVLSSEDMITKEDLQRTEFYNDWVKPQENIVGGGGAVIERGLTSSALFGGNIREQDRERLEPQWMQLVRLILPMLQSGWRINRLLAASELEKLLPMRARTTNAAVLLTDQRDRLVYANQAAETLLMGGAVIDVTKNGRLTIADMPHKLDDFLKPGLSRFSEFTLSDQSRVWIGKLLPSTFEALDFSFSMDGFTPDKMVVISSHRETPDPVATLRRVFGLTAAEAEVALLISEGYDVNEISDLRAVSKNTVRFQVKAALDKVGVRRQTQLALAVARLVAY